MGGVLGIESLVGEQLYTFMMNVGLRLRVFGNSHCVGCTKCQGAGKQPAPLPPALRLG